MRDAMTTTAAVVVTYNRRELLKQCITHLLGQVGASCDIFIIDNASEDGTRAMVIEEYHATEIQNITSIEKNDEPPTSVIIYYYNTGENTGSAGGFNRGVKAAALAGYESIWLMDDDVFPDATALAELLKAARRIGDKWGCLSSYAYWKDGSTCKANRQKKGIFRFLSDSDYEKDLVPAMMVSNASMLVRTKAVKEVGLPIADYFFYTDDYEFSSRIGRRFSVFVVPRSRVLHAMEKNNKADYVNDTASRMYRYEFLFRNDIHLYREYGVKGHLYLLLKILYSFMRIVLKDSNRKEKTKTLLRGYRRGISFCPKVEYL